MYTDSSDLELGICLVGSGFGKDFMNPLRFINKSHNTTTHYLKNPIQSEYNTIMFTLWFFQLGRTGNICIQTICPSAWDCVDVQCKKNKIKKNLELTSVVLWGDFSSNKCTKKKKTWFFFVWFTYRTFQPLTKFRNTAGELLLFEFKQANIEK